MKSNSKKIRFEKCYAELVQPLFRYVYYQLGDEAKSEDVVQNVFVKYWEKLDSIHEDKEVAYLYASAKNMAINQAKKEQVRIRFKQRNDHYTNVKSPEYLLEEKEFKNQLENAISDLPEGQREVFLMHRIDALKYKDIALRLKISQKAVEKRMSQALGTLRKINKNI